MDLEIPLGHAVETDHVHAINREDRRACQALIAGVVDAAEPALLFRVEEAEADCAVRQAGLIAEALQRPGRRTAAMPLPSSSAPGAGSVRG